MWKNILRITVLAALLALPLSPLPPDAAWGAGDKPWIHIEVTEDGRDGDLSRVQFAVKYAF